MEEWIFPYPLSAGQENGAKYGTRSQKRKINENSPSAGGGGSGRRKKQSAKSRGKVGEFIPLSLAAE